MKTKRLSKMFLLLLAALMLTMPISTTKAGNVYWDDGSSHLINDDRYESDSVYLDYNIVNSPGTSVQVVNGGHVEYLGVRNYSTIKVDGGLISDGVSVSDNGELVVNGGTIGTIWSYDQSLAEVNGGSINGWILARDNSIVKIRGGIFADLSDLIAAMSGTIYLYGSNFHVGENELNYGDSVRDYGVVGGPNLNNLTGVITGTLLDNSLMNCEFLVPLNNPGGADIIVIPEPATGILLLTSGVLFLRWKRQSRSFSKCRDAACRVK